MSGKGPLRRFDLLKINASGAVVLAVGFLNTLLVPKMAIKAMGIDGYGVYATLLGICLIPTFLDFGIMPGLTRQIGTLHTAGEWEEVRATTRRLQRLLGGLGVVVVAGLAALMAGFSAHGREGGLAILLGGGANVTMMITELVLVGVRVSGGLVPANLCRCLYFSTYLAWVGAVFLAHHLNIVTLFGGQALGSLAYLTIGFFLVSRIARGRRDGGGEGKIPWRPLLRSALPEQVNRVQSAFLPGAERALMLAAGGPAQVGAYDIALRLSALVTALPATIAEPMVALLAPRMGEEGQSERRMIMRHGDQATIAITVVALMGALSLAAVWAVPYYHLEGTSFLPFVAMIMVGSGFNVLTATRGAALYAAGRPEPVLIKGLGDLTFAAVALGALVLTSNPLIYVGLRYLGFFATAGGFLLYWFLRGQRSITAGGER